MKAHRFSLSLTFIPVLTLAIGAVLSAAPQGRGGAAGFTPDKGRFRILLDGADAGSESFELSQSGNGWIARGDATLKVPKGGDMHATGQLRLSADGAPTRYDWTSQSPKKASGYVDFTGNTAKTVLSVDGKEAKQDFTFPSPKIAVLDNNLYDQYAIIGHLYDWNAKGVQTFPVLIPQDLTPGSITAESISPSNGAVSALRVRTSDVAIELYFDSNRHLARLAVPAAKVVVMRQ